MTRNINKFFQIPITMAINEDKLKNSFKKVKEEMNLLSDELKEAKELIINQNKLIKSLELKLHTIKESKTEEDYLINWYSNLIIYFYFYYKNIIGLECKQRKQIDFRYRIL